MRGSAPSGFALAIRLLARLLRAPPPAASVSAYDRAACPALVRPSCGHLRCPGRPPAPPRTRLAPPTPPCATIRHPRLPARLPVPSCACHPAPPRAAACTVPRVPPASRAARLPLCFALHFFLRRIPSCGLSCTLLYFPSCSSLLCFSSHTKKKKQCRCMLFRNLVFILGA